MSRCADCGFLGIREETSRLIAEVEIKIRKDWVLPHTLSNEAKRYEPMPICLAMARDFDGECGGKVTRDLQMSRMAILW